MGFQYILYQRNLIAEAFDEIYGPEAQKWDEHTKNEYKKQQSDLLYSNYSRGLMTNVSHKINFESYKLLKLNTTSLFISSEK